MENIITRAHDERATRLYPVYVHYVGCVCARACFCVRLRVWFYWVHRFTPFTLDDDGGDGGGGGGYALLFTSLPIRTVPRARRYNTRARSLPCSGHRGIETLICTCNVQVFASECVHVCVCARSPRTLGVKVAAWIESVYYLLYYTFYNILLFEQTPWSPQTVLCIIYIYYIYGRTYYNKKTRVLNINIGRKKKYFYAFIIDLYYVRMVFIFSFLCILYNS